MEKEGSNSEITSQSASADSSSSGNGSVPETSLSPIEISFVDVVKVKAYSYFRIRLALREVFLGPNYSVRCFRKLFFRPAIVPLILRRSVCRSIGATSVYPIV